MSRNGLNHTQGTVYTTLSRIQVPWALAVYSESDRAQHCSPEYGRSTEPSHHCHGSSWSAAARGCPLAELACQRLRRPCSDSETTVTTVGYVATWAWDLKRQEKWQVTTAVRKRPATLGGGSLQVGMPVAASWPRCRWPRYNDGCFLTSSPIVAPGSRKKCTVPGFALSLAWKAALKAGSLYCLIMKHWFGLERSPNKSWKFA